jgi:1,4-dihydroxy-2-naphthoate octaprenyltransferase
MTALLRLSRPLLLLLAALTYTLGASVPAYLGKPLQGANFWLGLAITVFAQISMSLLAEVFRPINEPLLENETRAERELFGANALYVSIAALTVNAVLIFLLYLNQALTLASVVFLFSSVVLLLAYAVPPVRLLNRGFGELALAAQIAYIAPSIGFLLQFKENHRLLFAIVIPLTALALAYFLILNFVSFLPDQKYQRDTLLRRLAWERAVPLHHSLVVFAYAVFAIALLSNFFVLWTAFLTLPFAILQIILLRHVSLGGKPNWSLLSATALAVFGLTSYFLTLAFWMR